MIYLENRLITIDDFKEELLRKGECKVFFPNQEHIAITIKQPYKLGPHYLVIIQYVKNNIFECRQSKKIRGRKEIVEIINKVIKGEDYERLFPLRK
jgi:hypothetical protein